jgi:hypothetical protein
VAGGWPADVGADDVKEDEDQRLPGENGDLSLASRAAASDASGVAGDPGDVEDSRDSLFVPWANQLFVAAIACLTAWRPVSNTPFPGVMLPGRELPGP